LKYGKRTEIHFTRSEIIMDHNHILAGKTLIFEVTLVEIMGDIL
jgi:FKBP-type peptidyl-prolyl cis-trans isomerase 2